MELVQKIVYSYDFKTEEMKPLIETHEIIKQDDILKLFGSRELIENKQVEKEDESLAIAEVQDDVSSVDQNTTSYTQTATEKESHFSKHYAITYYNPLTHKAEVLEVISDICIKDYAQQKIEEATGVGSTYPIYRFIAQPFLRVSLNPQVIEDIVNNADYDESAPSSGQTTVRFGKKSEIVALEKNAVRSVIMRKEKVEEKLKSEVVAIDRVVSAIRKGVRPESAVEELPALSKAKFKAALEKGKINRKTLLKLLERDLTFAKGIKKKLESMGLKDLMEIIKAMSDLKSK